MWKVCVCVCVWECAWGYATRLLVTYTKCILNSSVGHNDTLHTHTDTHRQPETAWAASSQVYTAHSGSKCATLVQRIVKLVNSVARLSLAYTSLHTFLQGTRCSVISLHILSLVAYATCPLTVCRVCSCCKYLYTLHCAALVHLAVALRQRRDRHGHRER